MNKDKNEIPDSILERIQKLYNNSLSFKKMGSLAESEAFMLKVQALLSEYNLEMSLLGEKAEKSTVTEDKIKYKGLVSYGDWEVDLMTVICKYNWCKCIYNSYSTTMTIIGRGDNIGVCKYLYNYITINLAALSKQSYYGKIDAYAKQADEKYGVAFRKNLGKDAKFEEFLHKNKYIPYRRYYIRDYLAGAVEGIDTKFAIQQREQSKQAGVNGLILFNKAKLDEYILQFHGKLFSDDSKVPKRGQGYNEGYSDGKNLRIGEGIDGLKAKAYIQE